MSLTLPGEPSFTLGVEEEFWLVNLETLDLVSDPPRELLNKAQNKLGHRVSGEFLRCQIEIGTDVCRTASEARSQLGELRGTLVDLAERYDIGLMAASTHPFANWEAQRHTDNPRYETIAKDLRTAVERLLICGMHVHVGIDHDDLRIELMNQAAYFLPHLLALTTSSPFWRGKETGLNSYRLSVFDNLPRTGLPEHFSSYAEYRRHVDMLVSAGVIEDATKLWWDMRPSDRYATLEMRVTDVCTTVDDTVTVAALTACLLRMLYRLRRNNQRWRTYAHMLVQENRWRACRYGSSAEAGAGLIDFGRGEIIPYAELLEEIFDLVAPDVEALGCEKEVLAARDILARGTSASRQVETYRAAREKGLDEAASLKSVAQFLVDETRRI